MSGKFVITLICCLLFVNCSYASEIPVKVTPKLEVTTSNYVVQEGDEIEFCIFEDVNINSKLVFKQGQPVFGTLTSRVENACLGKFAELNISDFYLKTIENKKIKLSGNVYKRGTCHDIISGIFPFELFNMFFRGGEVKILPQKDKFILYAEGS